jgi:hypothetical protein
VARAFVAHESVLGVVVADVEVRAGVLERTMDLDAPLARDVWIARAPRQQERPVDAPGVREARRRAVRAADGVGVETGRVEAGGRPDGGLRGGAEGEMAADAPPAREERAGSMPASRAIQASTARRSSSNQSSGICSVVSSASWRSRSKSSTRPAGSTRPKISGATTTKP